MNDSLISMDELRRVRGESFAIRREYTEMLFDGKITFRQLVKMSEVKKLKTLGGMRPMSLLGRMPGWTPSAARRAFVSNGLPERMIIRECARNENKELIIAALFESTPSKWQKRLRAPKGWPWFGNLLDAVKDVDPKTLPEEMREAVRYQFPIDTKKSDDDGLESLLGIDDDDFGEAPDEDNDSEKNEDYGDDDYGGDDYLMRVLGDQS